MTPNEPLDPETPLASELRWVIFLRWFAGTIVVLAPVVSIAWTPWSPRHTWVLATGAAILAYNLAVAMLFRRHVARWRGAVPLWLSWGQILLDLVALTVIVVWTGGTASPLLGLFILHLIFASLLLPPTLNYLTAVAIMAFVALGLLVTGQWPEGWGATAPALGFVVTLLFTAYLTSHIARSLRSGEGRLRSQIRRTNAILETAADGIITIDERGDIHSVNPAAESMFGYRREELIGRNVSMLMPEPFRGEHDEHIGTNLRTGEARAIGIGRQSVGRRKDGAEFPLGLAVSELMFEGRRYFTGIVRDISDRVEAEASLRKLNSELHRHQQALVQHEKMAAMGQLAAGVAHEISNPLASMDSLIQLVRRHPDRLKGDTAERLQEQVTRISRVVREMTDFAHPNETEWEHVGVNDLATGALDMVRFDHRLRSIDVVQELDPKAGEVFVMPHAIRQVLVNLIMNAVDAVADVREPRLTIATRREGDRCIIEVADNGHGIPVEDQGRVFEPFFTTKSVGRGTGLGLSISYALVERHQGRISVESEPGRGTRFLVELAAGGASSRPQEPAGGPDS